MKMEISDLQRQNIIRGNIGNDLIETKRMLLRLQNGDIKTFKDKVQCVCGKWMKLEKMFKCYHCWLWFCRDCAGKHFKPLTPRKR